MRIITDEIIRAIIVKISHIPANRYHSGLGMIMFRTKGMSMHIGIDAIKRTLNLIKSSSSGFHIL